MIKHWGCTLAVEEQDMSWFVFCCCPNQLRKKRVYLSYASRHSPSLREVGAGTWPTPCWLAPLLKVSRITYKAQARWLKDGTPHGEGAPHTLSWSSIIHQQLRKCPHRHAHRPMQRKHPLSWRSALLRYVKLMRDTNYDTLVLNNKGYYSKHIAKLCWMTKKSRNSSKTRNEICPIKDNQPGVQAIILDIK